ncbi:MAG: FHA domain-containing protein [Gammaproteobacteria bacterium]|nr:FHA domain-containing protein [Gammaproteobacteria bacterium]
MGKLVIKFRGNQIGDVALKLGDTTIGRDPACDVVLKDDKSVSKKHAVIKTVGNKSTLEDQGSTNGTFIEDKRIQRHELKHGQIIIISEHELIYRDDVVLAAPSFGQRPTASAATSQSANDQTRIITSYAQLVTLDGKDKGKHLSLMKEETLLDNPGKSPARIYRGPDGYVLHAQLGPGEPRLNDKPVPPGGQILENGDIIEVAGTKFQFV